MKKSEKIVLIAIDYQSNINKDKKPCCDTFSNEKNIFWIIDERNFSVANFFIKFRNFIEEQKKAISIDGDSFVRLLDKDIHQQIISAIYSAVNSASQLPFSLKTKQQPTVQHEIFFSKSFSKEVELSKVITESENFARKLQLMPSNILNQEKFVSEISEKFKGLTKNVKIKIFHKKDLERMKMNLILGVGKASNKDHEPKLVVIEYKGSKKNNIKTAFVGKGILFDTGGLSLKPTNYMTNMHHDMSGAAIVAATIYAYAKLNVPANIYGVLPLVNNDIGSSAIRINDIITSFSKQTVEITNTDAEGRLILADAVAFAAKNLKVETVLTIATLTGAASVSFGETYTPVWCSNDENWEMVKESAAKGFDLVWRMPLHFTYAEKMKNTKVADFINSEPDREAGSTVAAEFIRFFCLNKKFIHFDIAGSSEHKKLPIPVTLRTLFELGKRL